MPIQPRTQQAKTAEELKQLEQEHKKLHIRMSVEEQESIIADLKGQVEQAEMVLYTIQLICPHFDLQYGAYCPDCGWTGRGQ